jgi:hypothetical protein
MKAIDDGYTVCDCVSRGRVVAGKAREVGDASLHLHAREGEDGMQHAADSSLLAWAGEEVYALITYKFPVLSAKAVPDLQNFLKQWIVDK